MRIEAQNVGYVLIDDNGRQIFFKEISNAKRMMIQMQEEEELRNSKELNLEPVESYLFYKWKMKTGSTIRVIDMPRSHVRNTLQWCLRRNASPDDEKDNIPYSQWIAYFTRRLLDPNLEE